jgi:hypothetical protein
VDEGWNGMGEGRKVLVVGCRQWSTALLHTESNIRDTSDPTTYLPTADEPQPSSPSSPSISSPQQTHLTDQAVEINQSIHPSFLPSFPPSARQAGRQEGKPSKAQASRGQTTIRSTIIRIGDGLSLDVHMRVPVCVRVGCRILPFDLPHACLTD